MQTGKVLLIGCGAVAAVLAIVGIAGAAFVWHVSQDPVDISIRVEGPEGVKLREEFALTVFVRNDRKKADFLLTTLDVADEYLDGFTLVATEPAHKSNTHIPLDNKRSYRFDSTVKAGETARFVLRLRPLKPGVFRGDIDACEGMRFLTTEAETLVEQP